MTRDPDRVPATGVAEKRRPPLSPGSPPRSSNTDAPCPPPGRRQRGLPAGYTLGWVLALILAVLTTARIMQPSEPAWLRHAFAQAWEGGTGAGLGARGIYAFPAQVGPKEYGLFMMDVDTGTLWCYEIARGRTGEPFLKLLAARSWLSDRYLEEFNVAEPTPSQVRELIEQQRALRRPTESPVAPSPPPDTPTRTQAQPAPLEVPESP